MRSQKSFSLLLAVRLLGDDLGGAPPKAVICFSRFTWESRVSTAQSLRGRPTVGRVDATVGMSSSAGIVCALTSACGLQGPFTPAASCPFNKGALDEPYELSPCHSWLCVHCDSVMVRTGPSSSIQLRWSSMVTCTPRQQSLSN